MASNKIKSLDELAETVRCLKKENKKIVHCHGVFDLLHPGHIKHFEAAKREGDVLIVTITKDEFVNKGPGRPVFNQYLRMEFIAAIESVDYVALNQWPTAVETIKKLKPDVYVKGSDYANRTDDLSGKIYEEEKAIKDVGGSIKFTDEVTFSSTQLLNTYFNIYPEQTKQYLEYFRSRYSSYDIISRLKTLKNMNVLVIGDTIIDEYDYCHPMGKSVKGVHITTKYLEGEKFAGGVLATANHVAGFCKHVHLVTCLGNEVDQKDFIQSHLKENIKPQFFFRNDAPTVVKRRYIDSAFLSKMFEVCYLNDSDLPELLAGKVCKYLNEIVKDYDLVITADFGHGFIGGKIMKTLVKKARFLAVNTQTNSANIGFNLITKYPKANYICIDEPEIRLATHDRFGNLKDLIIEISKQLNCNKIIITRGHKGSTTYDSVDGFCEVPVFSKDVVDTVGAGDAFYSITSPCIVANFPMDMVGFVGNAVGALAVLVVGNRSSIEPLPLYKYIEALLK